MRRRELARLLAEDEPIPDVWAGIASTLRGVLERREREREARRVAGLSRSAIVVLFWLDENGGSSEGMPPPGDGSALAAAKEAGLDVQAGLKELLELGVVELTWAVSDGDWPPVPLLVVRYDV